ncbi:MAG: 2-succinyl-5-enolpyruvyl-6-hydroxy-3-cyclohexene-1-carboxylic-acid synthase, partial [Actinomycetes bacterium]
MEPLPPNSDDERRSAGDVAATYCATLVDEWAHLGVRYAVVAPGSRSTPMAVALLEHPDLHVELHHDERSAAFTALGVGLATKTPALLLCTSGTAAAEFHPAVVEAHQAGVPMIVITADRPAELQGVGAPQTIDQRNLYGPAVRWYCEPGAPEAGGSAWWRDLAADAWLRTGGTPPGPVHLNLAFREPLVGAAGPLPPRPAVEAVRVTGAGWHLPDEELGRLAEALDGRSGVIVAGARAGSTETDRQALLSLAETLGWPVLADPTSGCRVGHRSV